MTLTQLLALLAMSIFLLRLQPTTLSRHLKAAMMFDEYPRIETEGRKKGHATGDIRLLQGLAVKLMELAQAGGEINEDGHPEDSENKGIELNCSFTPEQQAAQMNGTYRLARRLEELWGSKTSCHVEKGKTIGDIEPGINEGLRTFKVGTRPVQTVML
ncbi:hypothetical protein F4604DRAFT_1683511 [Suillus subluteus]|nr:hypothetical protein F4604DRAFT_1683511 [Suillus subluteus]